MESPALAAARDAFARRAWTQAYEQFSTADKPDEPLNAEDLERFAISACLVGRYELSVDVWSRAHNEYLRHQNFRRAARCSFWIALDLWLRGESARANGWLARGRRVLSDRVGDCAECGLLLVLRARQHLGHGDVADAQEAARQSLELASRFDDPELAAFSRLIVAQVSARRGEAAQAAAMFDEIMVAVTVGEVSPIGVGIVYCAVIEGCWALLDVMRAREWTAALSRWCEGQPDLFTFRGACQLHRAELSRLSGAWTQALSEADEAGRLLKSTGAALYQRGEVLRLRGDFTRAEAAYRDASAHACSPEPGWALLRLSQGRCDAAAAAIRRALADSQNPLKRTAVLAAAVEIMVAADDLPAARAAADELSTLAAASGAAYLRAVASQAVGNVRLAEGNARKALAALRAAWIDWQDIDAPWEAARVRVLLGLACRALGDEEAADLEFAAAHGVFERLNALPDLARVAALRHASGPRGAGGLTHRERQVIGLLATGRTNRAIAEALGISERTVDRHVSNILTKLDLPSRAAATAYAYEQGLLQPQTSTQKHPHGPRRSIG